MRDIRDIIEELHDHPDYIVGDVFTIHDVMDYIQDEIAEEIEQDEFELNIDDLSNKDKKAIQGYMENMLDQIWRHAEDIYPSYNNLPDLRIKIDRELNLEEILKK
jgi:hypothetical protein